VNVTIHLEKDPQHPDMAWLLRKSPRSDGLEFDIRERLESVVVRLGPYDHSDLIKIERDPDTGEIRVLHYSDADESPEVVLSVLEEQP